MATMRDVATRAGVSIATVSFVVNDTKPVSSATRRRIERAMVELGYRRNVVARALASQRTRIIALAYPALDHRLSGSAMEFVTAAASAASERGYHLVLWPVGNDGGELTELVGQGLVDGVLLMELQLHDPRVELLQQAGTPFALIGRTADPSGLPHVDIDFDATIAGALDHLTGLGHRRVVLVSGSQEQASFRSYGPYVRSEAAFARLGAERGLETEVLVCRSSPEAGRRLADELLAEVPEATGVVIMNEFAALGLLAGLRTRGIRVPADLSVISVIGSDEMASIADPPLTIMRAPGSDLGRLGLDALVRRLEAAEPLPPQLVPCVFVPGSSTARPRRRRRLVA
jgi:DNA-binding LacI/PurR family transcriptional regulator